MEQEFKVFSMMADTTVFTGTKPKCEEYIRSHYCADDSMYIIPAK